MSWLFGGKDKKKDDKSEDEIAKEQADHARN